MNIEDPAVNEHRQRYRGGCSPDGVALSEHQFVTAVPGPALPRGRPAPVTPDKPESLLALAGALGALAAAADVAAVSSAAAAGAAALTGARGAAVAAQRGDSALILGSWGYDCDSMAAGAVLPLDAGLPLTECVRTGRTITRGSPGNPAWVAVPIRTARQQAALLVSLPPTATPDMGALHALAGATGDALSRCGPVTAVAAPAHTDQRAEVVEPPPWLLAAASTGSIDGTPGGDVVLVRTGAVDDEAWIVVADVCGDGAAAAPAAQVCAAALSALTSADLRPAALLAALDRTLRREGPVDRHVTVLAVHLRREADGVLAEVATAGHPPLQVLRDGELVEIGRPGPPLNLIDAEETTGWPVDRLHVAAGDVLLGHTDGLVDRDSDRGEELGTLFSRAAAALDDPAAVVDALVAAMEGVGGTPRDDVAAVVARLPWRDGAPAGASPRARWAARVSRGRAAGR